MKTFFNCRNILGEILTSTYFLLLVIICMVYIIRYIIYSARREKYGVRMSLVHLQFCMCSVSA